MVTRLGAILAQETGVFSAPVKSTEILASVEVQETMARLYSLAGGDRMAIRHAIAAVEEALLKMPQDEQEPEVFFAEGLYGRKIARRAGCLVVTKLHKQENISALIRGKMAVFSEDGYKILEAPQFFVTKPGTKRVIFGIEDYEFTTVHPNPDNERDLDVLESRIIAEDFSELDYVVGCLDVSGSLL